MRNMVREAEKTADRTEGSDGSILPSMKTFMDDIHYCLMRSSKSTNFLVQSLVKRIEWARMKFKAAKSISVSLTEGRVSPQSLHWWRAHPNIARATGKKSWGGMLCHWLTDTVERRYTKSCPRASKLLKMHPSPENSRCRAFSRDFWHRFSGPCRCVRHHYVQDKCYGTPGKQQYLQMAWCTKEPQKWSSIFLFSQVNTSNHSTDRGIQGGKGRTFPHDTGFQWSSCLKSRAWSVI